MLADNLRKNRARARLKSRLKRLYFGIASVLYMGILFTPSFGVLAQESSETALDPAKQGPQEPTGPENKSYVYNEATGLWENDYYTWNPTTKQTAPKGAQEYSYNPETDKWDGEYVYSAEQQKYVKPAPKTTEPTQTDSSHTQTTEQNDSPKTESAVAGQDSPAPKKSASLYQSPASGGELVVKSNDVSGAFDLFFDADISINVDANSKSGDASVLQNTTGGNATSGDAQSEAYILNIIQSLLGSTGTLPELYVSNIQGDYFGDIMIDPTQLAGGVQSLISNTADLDVNADNNIDLENNVNLVAQSGSATVSGNTSAGDASTGNATAIANIVNMINSSIAANQSFFGVLNVNGNLDGDVLFSDNLTEQLLAANVPSSQISLNNTDLDIELDNNITIADNISAVAQSGNAEVVNNTNAGNATSGDAQTNVTVFNLIGHNVSADKALLVFVNVAGEWVGFITNSPVGSTAAAFGSNVASSSLSGDIDATNSIGIANNVNLLAQSGDATVSNNTNAGNATSGDATANASVANIVNTSFNLSDYITWLFINITGNWCGSVGTDTECGDAPVVPPIPSSNPSKPRTNSAFPAIPAQINSNNIRFFSVSFADNTTAENPDQPIALASVTEILPEPEQENFASPEPANSQLGTWLFIGSIILGYVVIFQGGRIMDIFRRS